MLENKNLEIVVLRVIGVVGATSICFVEAMGDEVHILGRRRKPETTENDGDCWHVDAGAIWL